MLFTERIDDHDYTIMMMMMMVTERGTGWSLNSFNPHTRDLNELLLLNHFSFAKKTEQFTSKNFKVGILHFTG